MATLYIKEYAELLVYAGVDVQIPLEPPVAEQTVAIGGAHAESAAFNANTRFVQLHADAICSISLGTAPAAATTNERMAANDTRFKGVPMGGNFKVSVISNT